MILPSVSPARTDVARHYDDLDRFYRELWGEHLHHGLWSRGDERPDEAVEALVRRVAELAGIGPGDRVCDVGCGYGAPAYLLAGERGARVVGYTLSEVQYRVAAAGGGSSDPGGGKAAAGRRTDGSPDGSGSGGTVTVRLGDWLESDLAPESFDAVLAIESTEHMADRARFFREAYRVLRPGGRLVVCAWLADSDAEPWQVRRLLEPICSEGRLHGIATAEECRGWASATGFARVRVEDLTDRVRRTWSVVLRRLAGALVRPATWRFLFRSDRPDGVFALTVARIWLAYRVGALRYGVLAAARPRGRRGRASPEKGR